MDGVINLDKDDPAVLDQVIRYLYTLDYNDGGAATSEAITTEKDPRSSITPKEPMRGKDVIPPEQNVAPSQDGEARVDQSLSADLEAKLIDRYNQEQIAVHVCLIMNTNVYAMADKFDIPKLKQLAKLKFEHHAKKWPHTDFPAVIHRILECTPSNDRGLREVCVGICAEHVYEITGASGKAGDTKKWATVLREDADFTLAVLRQAAYKLYNVSEYKSAVDATLVADLEEAKQQRRKAAETSKASEGVIDRLIQALNKIERCRHCGVDFRPSFERSYLSATGYFLRCKLCRTKHDL